MLKHKGCLFINVNQISLFSSTNNCTIDIFTVTNGKHNHHMHYLIIPCAWFLHYFSSTKASIYHCVHHCKLFNMFHKIEKGLNECIHIKRNQRHQGQTLFQGLHLTHDIPCWFIFWFFTFFIPNLQSWVRHNYLLPTFLFISFILWIHDLNNMKISNFC